MKFNDLWPTTFEVTFIPLVLCTILFFLCLQIHVYLTLVPLLLYVLMCLFFIACDLFDEQTRRLVLPKLVFVLGCVSPMIITLLVVFLLR